MNEPGGVGDFKVLKDMPRREEAMELLKKLHSLCKPIQKKYGWYLPQLVEFFPENPGLLGMNMNRGQKIFIRLRPHHDKNSFLPLEEMLVGTLLHEFSHNFHGPHDKNFYAFLDKLQDEYDVLRSSGYSGEGFLSDGKRMGGSHNLNPYEARAKALAEAGKRAKLAKIMGPPGGRTLGVANRANAGKSPRELAAAAAERRARDSKACGHGEGVADATVAHEAEKAEQDTASDAQLHATTSARLPNMEQKEMSRVGSSSSNQQNRKVVKGSDSDSDIEVIEINSAPIMSVPKRQPASSSAPLSHKQHVQPVAPKYWTCSTCTFENDKPQALACEVCGSVREGVHPTQGTDTAPWQPPAWETNGNVKTKTHWICHRCGGETEHAYWTCRLCGILKLSS